MNSKVKIGTFEVLISYSIMIEIGKPIDISFGDVDQMNVIFNIINDPGKNSFSSEARLVNQTTIEIDLLNFVTTPPSGGGTKQPVKVGTFQNRLLYYSFSITSMGGGVQPIFNCTFYLGEEITNA